MNVTLLAEDRIRLEGAAHFGIAAADPDVHLSPFHLLASGLAGCVYSVMYSWAEHAGLAVGDLAIEVGWSFTEDPYRLGELELELIWPSLPEARRAAAARAAHLCPIHQTLQHSPQIHTRVREA